MTDIEPREVAEAVGVMVDRQVLVWLVESAVDQIWYGEQEDAPDGCCPRCCAPCAAVKALLDAGELDDLLRVKRGGSAWWDTERDQVDRGFLANAWRLTSCHDDAEGSDTTIPETPAIRPEGAELAPPVGRDTNGAPGSPEGAATAQRFRLVPFTVEAMRWEPTDPAAVDRMAHWLNGHDVQFGIPAVVGTGTNLLLRDSWQDAEPGAWVIRREDGWAFTLDEEQFAESYVAVEAS